MQKDVAENTFEHFRQRAGNEQTVDGNIGEVGEQDDGRNDDGPHINAIKQKGNTDLAARAESEIGRMCVGEEGECNAGDDDHKGGKRTDAFRRLVKQGEESRQADQNRSDAGSTDDRLFTMGHSLDITDRDIMEELFRNASEIVILYHNFDAKKSYIANLIKIFGKDGFDILKKDKKLSFVSLNDDLKSIKATLSQEAQKDIEIMLCSEIGEPIAVI